MESKELEDLSNTTGPEDETLANLKKRRRVSFADNITTFHVFDRDEEFETPPDAQIDTENGNVELEAGSEFRRLRGDSADSDDSKELQRNEDEDEGDDGEEEEEEEEEGRQLFVRNMDFSSPGSVAGSVTSNEEDNFFGPVSTSFIRSGRLSTDSAASDNNHDITMDSTAFSLHFRNLMQSDEQTSNTEGNYKTPTGLHLAFGEKTSENSKLTNGGNFMVLTGIKKLIPHYTSGGRSDGGGDSNDMSLIVENPRKYDYGNLSPRLDALLAEGQNVSVSNQINISKSSESPSSMNRCSAVYEHMREPMDLSCPGSPKVQTIKGEHIPSAVLSEAVRKHSDADDDHGIRSSGRKTSASCSSSIKVTLPSDTPVTLQNGKYKDGVSSCVDNESFKEAFEVSQSQIELGFSYNGHTKLPLNKASPMNPIIQVDYGPTGYVKDQTGENNDFSHSSSLPAATSPVFTGADSEQRLVGSLKNGSYGLDVIDNAHIHEFSSPGSISSLRAKRQRLSLATSVSVGKGQISTPFAEWPCSHKEGAEHGALLSIKKEISKFKMSEICDGVYNSKLSLSGLANKPSLSDDVLVTNDNDPKAMATACSVTDVEGHLLANAEESTALEIEVETHGSRVETPKKFNTSRLSGKSPSVFHGAGHWSGKHMDESPIKFDAPMKGAASTPQSPSQVNKTAELKNIKQVIRTPSKFVSSPVKGSEQKISASISVSSPLRTFNQQNLSDTPIRSSPIPQIEDPLRTTCNVNQLLTPGVEGNCIEPSSLLKENRRHTTMPSVNINTDEFTSLAKCEETANQNSFLQGLQMEIKSAVSYQTPMSNRVNLTFCSASQDKNAQKMDRTKFFGKFSLDGKFKDSLHESAPADISRKTGTRTLSEKGVESASREQGYNFKENNNLILPSRKFPVSPTLLQGLRGSDRSDSQISPNLQRSLFIPDAVSSRRRTSDLIVLAKKNHMGDNDIDMRQKGRNVLVGEGDRSTGCCSENNMAGSTKSDMIRDEPSVKHWSDVFSKLCAAPKELLPAYTDKLNPHELGILEDVLGQLQRLQKYEKIFAGIQSQKTNQHLGNSQRPRVVEARWLQHTLVFERLKLQLFNVKRDRLLRKVQQLQSCIQDCHELKLYISRQKLGKRDAQSEGRHIQSNSIEWNTANQDSYHTVIKMKKELGVLDNKVKKITKFFQYSCKIKGDRNSDEIVAFVNDHLQKHERCRLIRQYFLLWNLDDIERKDDCCNIVLDYHSLLSQRLTKSNVPVSSIVSSNLLNEAIIKTNFPNMNAGVAFKFVFNDKNNCRLGNSRSFQQETKLTSFLLGNLLDVVEEVQAAKMEVSNLIKASFQSPSAGHLELQLCFIDFKIGRKVTLILDMTELNCGVYPSEIVQSHLKIEISGARATAASLSTEILDVVRSLTAAQHSMIIRLCRCISQVLQSSSR